MGIILTVMVLYLVACIAIGIFSRGRVKTEDDFLAAGGKIGILAGGSSLAAAQMSVGTSIGTVGFIYANGYNFSWIWPFIWVAWGINAFWIGPKLKNFYVKTGALTVPDFVGARFESDFARTVTALILLVAFSLTIMAELIGIGTIFSVALNIPPMYTITVCAVVFIIYTIGGGLFSVIYTSLFQMCIFLVGFVSAAVIAVNAAGGLIQMNTQLAAIDASLIGQGMPVSNVIAGGLSFGFMMIGYPLIAVRFYAIKDKKAIRDSCGIAIVLQAVIATCVCLMGVSARVLFPDMLSPDHATATIAINLLPAVLGGLLLAAVLASSQSTASGVLLMVSSAVSYDIVKSRFRPNMTDEEVLKMSRIILVIIGLVCIPLTQLELPLIQQIWIDAASIIGSTFAMPTLLGVIWKRPNRLGGTLSIIFGFVCSTGWMLLGNPYGVSCIYLGVVGSLVGLLIGTFSSPPPSEETIKLFFEEAEA